MCPVGFFLSDDLHISSAVYQHGAVLLHQPGEIFGLQEDCVILFQPLHDGCDDGSTAQCLSALHAERHCRAADLFRESGLVHIDPHTKCHMIDIIDLCAHLREDACQFFPVYDDIIGPFDLDTGDLRTAAAVQLLFQAPADPFRHTACHDQGEHGGPCRRDLRTEKDRHIDAAPCRGLPGPASAPSSGGLAVRHSQCAVRRTFICRLPDPQVRGICHIIVTDLPPRPFCSDHTVQFFLCHHIRTACHMIASVADSLHLIPFFLELSDNLPHSGPGYAEPLAYLLPGDISVCLPEHSQYLCLHLNSPRNCCTHLIIHKNPLFTTFVKSKIIYKIFE